MTTAPHRIDTPAVPRWSIDDILARTDLASLLDDYAQAAGSQTRGRRWHCPVRDHADANASVTMHTDARGHERWRCWSGDDHHRGDAIDLLMTATGATRRAAIEQLAARAGLQPDQPLPPPRTRKPSIPEHRPLDSSVVVYVEACEKILWTNTGQPVRDWLHQRGFNDDLLRMNRVGADPGRQMLSRRRGLAHGTSLAATFPALGPDRDIRYVQTRYLEPAPNGPKYDNPVSRLGTNPRLGFLQPATRPSHTTLIVCEGIPDALTAAGAGFFSAGVLGSQAPDQRVARHLTRAAGRGHDLVLVNDADTAGRSWRDRLLDLLGRHDVTARTLEPPHEGLDLNAWALREPGWHQSSGIGAPDLRPSLDPGI